MKVVEKRKITTGLCPKTLRRSLFYRKVRNKARRFRWTLMTGCEPQAVENQEGAALFCFTILILLITHQKLHFLN